MKRYLVDGIALVLIVVVWVAFLYLGFVAGLE